jgi:uncharacterized protein Veg
MLEFKGKEREAISVRADDGKRQEKKREGGLEMIYSQETSDTRIRCAG